MKKAFSETLKMDIIAAVKNNLSPSEIVESCGVSMATAYRYKTKIDSLSSIKQISNAYKVDYQKLCRHLKANSKKVSSEPTYTWKEVVEIIYKKYNILLGD